MPIEYLETNVIAAYLIDAWQNALETEIDPTAGKWFRNGPENSAGLFGGLTDTLVTDLVFEPGSANVNKWKDVALSSTLDNRNGLLSESAATSTLQWQITNSTTTSHSKTNAVKSSLSTKYTVKATVPQVSEISKEIAFGIEYSYSWTETEAVTESQTKTFSQALPLKVPAGKAYKVIIMADKAGLKLPYRATIRLKGVSEANFPTQVKGKSRHAASAGQVCAWINKYGSAKDDAMEFEADAQNPDDGIAFIRGLMRVDQAIDFNIYALDVTETLTGDPNSAGVISQLLKGEQPDNLVSSTPRPAA